MYIMMMVYSLTWIFPSLVLRLLSHLLDKSQNINIWVPKISKVRIATPSTWNLNAGVWDTCWRGCRSPSYSKRMGIDICNREHTLKDWRQWPSSQEWTILENKHWSSLISSNSNKSAISTYWTKPATNTDKANNHSESERISFLLLKRNVECLTNQNKVSD